MAGLIRPLPRRFLLRSRYSVASISSVDHFKPLLSPLSSPWADGKSFASCFSRDSIFGTVRRNYISEMRKAAFEGNLLRLIRNEIQYELDRSPPEQPVPKFAEFTVDDRSGDQWICLTRKFGENEDIKVEATMFDGSVPASKSGEGAELGEEVQLHITFIVNISKGGDDVFEILCSAWPDAIEINKFSIRRREKMPAHPYMGPEFKELDDELQDAVYAFLEERGIDDQLAVFLHRYVKNKDKTEYLRWMDTLKSFIEKKK